MAKIASVSGMSAHLMQFSQLNFTIIGTKSYKHYLCLIDGLHASGVFNTFLVWA